MPTNLYSTWQSIATHVVVAITPKMVSLRIALVYEDLIARGGGQRLLLTQARFLQRSGYDVTVFTPAYSNEVYPELVQSLRLEVVPMRHARALAGFPIFGRTLSGFDDISRWCPSELAEQDLIIGYTFPSNITAYQAHMKWNVPVIWHCTHPSNWLYPRSRHDKASTAKGVIIQDITQIPFRILDKRASKVFSHILVISSKIGRKVREIYGLSSVVLFPIVDPAEFKASGLFPENPDSILYVGRLVWDKGPDLFLRVLKGVVSKIPHIKGIMALAGQTTSSYSFTALELAIARMGLQDHVELLTRIPSAAFDIAQLYERSGIIAYTSRDEDFGLVPLEASLCGRPSVVWDDCGCVQDKMLEDGKSALVASHYDIEEFVNKTVRLLRNPSLGEELSANARISTLRNCHPNAYVNQLEAIMRNLQ